MKKNCKGAILTFTNGRPIQCSWGKLERGENRNQAVAAIHEEERRGEDHDDIRRFPAHGKTLKATKGTAACFAAPAAPGMIFRYDIKEAIRFFFRELVSCATGGS